MPAISSKDGPVAVTGVTGFTGAHMVRELVIHGYKVRACLRDSESWRGQDGSAYLRTLPNVEIFTGCDLFEPGSYDAAFAGCSCVFAVAAVLGNSAANQPLASGDVGKDVYDGGMVGLQNIIDSINKSGTVKRLVYTSSMAGVSGSKKVPKGYEWTETDWASDGVDEKMWSHPANSYSRSKVDTEKMVNAMADASGGRWDAITMNPAMICGPLLFKAQNGQWIEQLGRIAAGLEPNWPSGLDMFYDIIDVRDLVAAHRLAAESLIDHQSSHGGPRYCLHGSGGRSAVRLGGDIRDIIAERFPAFELGAPATKTKSGRTISVQSNVLNDSKKAKEVLGVTLRPVEETIRDCIESSITLGVITPKLKSRL